MQNATMTPVPGLTAILNHFKVALKPKPERRPKFKVLTGPKDDGNPWRGTETDGDSRFVQFEITRDMKNVEVIAEVTACDGWSCGHEKDHTTSDCIEIGDCFDLYGFQRILTLEEEEDARKTWVDVQQMRAAKEAE